MRSIFIITSGSGSGSEQFILRVVIEYLLAPGYTGELAREALVLIVQVLLLAPESRDRQVAVLLGQARVAEMLVEHMSYLYSQVPVFRPMPRSPTARLFGSDYRGNRRLAPLDRRRRLHQAQTTSSSCRRIRPEHPPSSDIGAAETQPAHRHYDDVKPRLQALLARESVLRSVADQDRRELDILKSARVALEHVDAFFLTWELIDEIAAISSSSRGSEPRITTAVQRQLSNGFLRTHIVPALMAQMTSMSQAITTVSYLTDLVNATHSTAVLDALFAGATQAQPQRQQNQLQLQHPAPAVAAAEDTPGEGGGEDAMDVTEAELGVLSKEDRALLASIEDNTLRAEAAALLLPPGSDVSRILGTAAAGSSGSNVAANGPATTTTASGFADEGAAAAAAGATGADRRAASEPHGSLRATLIGWMTLEDNMHLSLSTMRLFDAILASMNQLAYTSLVLRNFAEGEEDGDDDDDDDDESESRTHCGFYSGPALGLGKSVAADQELVRAVVERFLDATPGNICNALPEAVVAAAMRIDKSPGSSAEMQTTPLLLQSQMGSVPLVREYQGCDEYVADILQRLRFNQEYLKACWLSKRQFIRQQQQQQHSIGISAAAAAAAATSAHASIGQAHAMTAALFYPGAFVRSLVDQFSMAVKRHMAYNLLLTSMASKLVAIADPALSAYLFLANSATVRPLTSSSPSQLPCALLYDSFVRASADAYVKSERIPRFAARLARQRREGVENAIKVGAAHPQARVSLAAASSSADVLRRSGAPGGDSGMGSSSSSNISRAHEDTARAAEFLGTPIKRFVHGYIVLDEFGKEMAAAAMALHTLELERAMDRLASQRVAPAVAADDDYADILDYFDPEEPAYKRALAVQQTLRTSSRAIIDLGRGSKIGRDSNNSVGSG
ncbi:hypothetical protein GGI11_001808 [Coemansia sp. RSA 2049]|nr:hypothetical protein GGI11_001808 [Coemansia sp. RSA 2049]